MIAQTTSRAETVCRQPNWLAIHDDGTMGGELQNLYEFVLHDVKHAYAFLYSFPAFFGTKPIDLSVE